MNHGTLKGIGLLGLLLLAGAAAPASAQTMPAGSAWVLANSPTSPSCYAPWAYASYNSLGASNTVCNLGTGRYSVDFAGFLGYGGNLQVVAFGDGNERCKIDYWTGYPNGTRAYIHCNAPSGALANSQFVAFFHNEVSTAPGAQWGAYLYAMNTGVHTPPSPWTWNANGGVNQIVYAGTGFYTAKIPGQHTFPNSVQVTAYGGTSEHCKISNWYVSSGDLYVTVLCFDTFGAPANSAFTLSYTSTTHNFGPGGTLWANDTVSSSYTPMLTYQYNSRGYTNTGANVGGGISGHYYPGMRMSGFNLYGQPIASTSLATAYGSGPAYCKLRNFAELSGSPVTTVSKVGCFDPSGVGTASMHVNAFMNNDF